MGEFVLDLVDILNWTKPQVATLVTLLGVTGGGIWRFWKGKYRSRLEAAKSELEELRSSEESLRQCLEERDRRWSETQEELRKAQEELSSARSDMDRINKVTSEGASKILQLEAERDKLDDEVDRLRRVISADSCGHARVDGHGAGVDALPTVFKDLSDDLVRSELELQRRDAEIRSLRQVISSYENWAGSVDPSWKRELDPLVENVRQACDADKPFDPGRIMSWEVLGRSRPIYHIEEEARQTDLFHQSIRATAFTLGQGGQLRIENMGRSALKALSAAQRECLNHVLSYDLVPARS